MANISSKRHCSGQPRQADSIEKRVGERIKRMPNGCWAFNGKLDRYGQMSLRFEGQTVTIRAHRFVYETMHGPIPDDMSVHHTCENPGCCNPDHLRVMPSAEHNRMHAQLPDVNYGATGYAWRNYV